MMSVSPISLVLDKTMQAKLYLVIPGRRPILVHAWNQDYSTYFRNTVDDSLEIIK